MSLLSGTPGTKGADLIDNGFLGGILTLLFKGIDLSDLLANAKSLDLVSNRLPQ